MPFNFDYSTHNPNDYHIWFMLNLFLLKVFLKTIKFSFVCEFGQQQQHHVKIKNKTKSTPTKEKVDKFV